MYTHTCVFVCVYISIYSLKKRKHTVLSICDCLYENSRTAIQIYNYCLNLKSIYTWHLGRLRKNQLDPKGDRASHPPGRSG